MIKRYLFLISFTFLLQDAFAQESMLKGIDDSIPPRQKVSSAFKSTRVINAHSTEMLAKGNLDFRILHRFGSVDDGVREWFGLDHASMRMSFDYGITNNLTVGIGRSTLRKEVDGFVKMRLLQQTGGPGEMPVSVVLVAGSAIHTEDVFNRNGVKVELSGIDRTSYYIQLVASRRFNDRFSLQFSPIFLHRNIVDFSDEDSRVFAPGAGARFKLNKRLAITADYHHPLGGIHEGYRAPLSVGLDIETGGHVFQLHFSNSDGMTERAYIAQTTGRFFNGELRFGFNLSRIFKIGGRKKEAK